MVVRFAFLRCERSPRSSYVCHHRTPIPNALTTARDAGSLCYRTPTHSKLKHARYLDECHALHEEHLGTLYGVPISVKMRIGMKGLRLDAGCISWWDEITKEDAHVLQVLQRAGAVFHARTTQR